MRSPQAVLDHLLFGLGKPEGPHVKLYHVICEYRNPSSCQPKKIETSNHGSRVILWMVEKILHQLVDGVFHYNPSTYSVS